ncbi:hypothetical protein HK096_010896 [Nowakowskiella sp. JEL0078]|nr:hypothetical protein HK096_010896 [Nowakowskiella sp. JEL0078]
MFQCFVGLEPNEVALFYVPDTNYIISASSFSINEGVFTRSQNHQFVDPFYFEEPSIQVFKHPLDSVIIANNEYGNSVLPSVSFHSSAKDQNDSDDEQVDFIECVYKTNFHGVSSAPNFGQSNNFDNIITISDDPSLDEVEVSGENTMQDSEIQLKSEPSGSKYINVTPLASNDSSSIQPSTPSPTGKMQAGPSKSVTHTPTCIAFGHTTKSPLF